MKNLFKYSVLKYRPSYLLDERVNIGLLFYFDSKFIFVYPSSLSRISNFFPDLTKLSDLRNYLSAFKKKAHELSRKDLPKTKTFEEIIHSEFIINDANSFFFSEIKSGSYTDIEKTLNHYKRDYFKYYEGKKSKKLPDSYLKNTFYNSLNHFAETKQFESKLKLFKPNIKVNNIIGKTEFEYGWQNGNLNLIKTLSFDLAEENSIQSKAFRWASAINYLQKTAIKANLQFDIIVAPPSQKSLFSSYDNALKVLDDIESNKKIIVEKQIEEYAEMALDTVKPFDIDIKSLE